MRDLHPAHAHDKHNEHLSFDTHLQIPNHDTRYWYDDQVHEYAESAT